MGVFFFWPANGLKKGILPPIFAHEVFWKIPSVQKLYFIDEKNCNKTVKWFTSLYSDILNQLQIGSKIEFVVFCRSNIKNEIWILQDISRTDVKYLARARAPTLPNEAQKFSWYARNEHKWAYQPTKFLRLIWMGWRARTRQIFYMCSRNVLKYSDFIFYVATTKNNKFDFGSFLDDLSKSLNN